MRYSFLRVYPSFGDDSESDFKVFTGTACKLPDAERQVGLARETNGHRGVPTYTVVQMTFAGYDADGEPAFLFQWVGPYDNSAVLPHDHRDNYNGGFAFAVYHPGTGLPQQPWAM